MTQPATTRPLRARLQSQLEVLHALLFEPVADDAGEWPSLTFEKLHERGELPPGVTVTEISFPRPSLHRIREKLSGIRAALWSTARWCRPVPWPKSRRERERTQQWRHDISLDAAAKISRQLGYSEGYSAGLEAGRNQAYREVSRQGVTGRITALRAEETGGYRPDGYGWRAGDDLPGGDGEGVAA